MNSEPKKPAAQPTPKKVIIEDILWAILIFLIAVITILVVLAKA